jgi:hypothetical protein
MSKAAIWFLGSMSIVLAGLSAVGASEGDLYRYSPPSGWSLFTQTNYTDRADAVWRGPISEGFAENVLILIAPTTSSLDEVATQLSHPKGMPGAQVHIQTFSTCGGHPAKYAYVTAPWRGGPLISEQVASVWNNTLYSAVYSRMSDQPTVESARSSLVTLCPSSAPASTTSW